MAGKDSRNKALALQTSATEVRILANKNGHSKLWKCFSFVATGSGDSETFDKKKAVCRLCKVVSPYSGNTTNFAIGIAHPLLLSVTLKEAEGDSSLIQQVKTAVSLDFEERYQDDDIQKLMKIGMCLDPRFKKIPYLTEVERTAIWLQARDELVAIIKDDRNRQESHEGSQSPHDRPHGNSSNGWGIVALQEVQVISKGLVGFLVDGLANKECQLVGILARSWNPSNQKLNWSGLTPQFRHFS